MLEPSSPLTPKMAPPGRRTAEVTTTAWIAVRSTAVRSEVRRNDVEVVTEEARVDIEGHRRRCAPEHALDGGLDVGTGRDGPPPRPELDSSSRALTSCYA